MSKRAGVYTIYNIITNKFYIGSSVNLRTRRTLHFRELKQGTHHSKYLQNSYNKYGRDNFIFKIIRECDPKDCISLEQYFINAISPEYNMCKIAGNCLGRKSTEETRKKMSLSRLGKKASEETRQKLRENIGKPIIQFDLQMNKLCEYLSISDASRTTGIHLSAIAHTLKGERKTSGGFKWKYKYSQNVEI